MAAPVGQVNRNYMAAAYACSDDFGRAGGLDGARGLRFASVAGCVATLDAGVVALAGLVSAAVIGVTGLAAEALAGTFLEAATLGSTVVVLGVAGLAGASALVFAAGLRLGADFFATGAGVAFLATGAGSDAVSAFAVAFAFTGALRVAAFVRGFVAGFSTAAAAGSATTCSGRASDNVRICDVKLICASKACIIARDMACC